jgi:O-antigen/teichoic acid export membrane protein
MKGKDHITGPAFLLVFGRTVGMVAAFAIGPVIARVFTIEDVGTYKQFFLVFATLYGLAQLGMAESLYYFVPRAAGRTGRYVCNAAITLAAAGLTSLVVLWIARDGVARYFDHPALAGYIVPVGLFLTFMLVGTVLEIMMVSRKQHMSAAVAYALSDIGRTALFILPALLFASLRAVFLGAVVYAALRLAVMLGLVWRQFGREFRPDLAIWRTQLAYALPFALAVGIEAILIYYHQFVVGGSFDRETFAIYAQGVMPIPFMDLVVTSTTSVMMVKMAEIASDRPAALTLFRDTVSRLAFLLLPLTIGLLVLAQPFIIALYTTKFAASVPVFMVWVLTIVPMMFAVDAVLRVYAQTRFLLVMNIIRFAVVAGLIGVLIGSFSLVGAVLATLTALAAAKAAGVLRIAHIMHVPVTQVLPWRTLARIAARALAAAAPAWWLSQLLSSTPWLAFVAAGTVYGVSYLVLSYAPGIAEPAAIRLPILERARELPIARRVVAMRRARNAAPCVAVAPVASRGDR